MVLPSVNEAIRARDRALTAREVADLAGRFALAAHAIRDATAALEAR
jgi:hypothetical protein